MKYILLLLITLTACQVKKETQNTDVNRLHDIWALTSLDGKDFDPSQSRKHPTLEIYVADKRVTGNDGCNNIFGDIETITTTELKFGALARTKMMCQNMEVTDKYGKLLAAVRTYTLKELNLYLYDESGKELLVFKKVD
jgi:heat shock protein HslJ